MQIELFPKKEAFMYFVDKAFASQTICITLLAPKYYLDFLKKETVRVKKLFLVPDFANLSSINNRTIFQFSF